MTNDIRTVLYFTERIPTPLAIFIAGALDSLVKKEKIKK